MPTLDYTQRQRLALHRQIHSLTQAIINLGQPGDTVAEAIQRIGPQHPLVIQRDSAVRAYRALALWNQDRRGRRA